MVQFHQNYSYEDFIMGYKPVDDGFELKMGTFYNFCKKAEGESDKPFFFIIDEINRGNLSKIFGELMMLIEGDKRGDKHRIKLAYKSELFSVPKNLYIIGMMNTADRSLAMMDYALRRRFSFFDVEPAFDKSAFKSHLTKYVGSAMADKVVSRFKELNKKIADESNSGLGKGYCIGHSYFCAPPVTDQTADEWYSAIIEYEITPLLYEYWWDDKDKAEDCIKELTK
jgi:5-methylcytosine-specific restriction protein B